jgi:hypothetical protein
MKQIAYAGDLQVNRLKIKNIAHNFAQKKALHVIEMR